MSIVHCEQLSKFYTQGERRFCVFEKINFSLLPGDQVAIVGASGSGKSTFLGILAGLDNATEGNVYWEGQSLSSYSEAELALLRNRFIGFVYQFHHLLPELNILDNIALPLYMRAKVSKKEAQERAFHWMKAVYLENKTSLFPAQLSGGERQRAALARSLVSDPECIFADEPTGHLDEKLSHEIMDLILGITKESGTAIVLVTHNLDIVERLSLRYRLSFQRLTQEL